MTDPIDPASPAAPERRRRSRRYVDPSPPPQVEGERANLPVASAAPASPAASPSGGTVFAAQVIGQEGQKRGLRGGVPVLEEARSAYLGAEYSGRLDRRPRRGAITKTEI